MIQSRTASSWTPGAEPRAPARPNILCAEHRPAAAAWQAPRLRAQEFPVVGSGSGRSTPAGLNRPSSSEALQCPSDCPGQSVHPGQAGSPNWDRHLWLAKWSPTMPLVAPTENSQVFPVWSPLAILLALTGAYIHGRAQAKGGARMSTDAQPGISCE